LKLQQKKKENIDEIFQSLVRQIIAPKSLVPYVLGDQRAVEYWKSLYKNTNVVCTRLGDRIPGGSRIIIVFTADTTSDRFQPWLTHYRHINSDDTFVIIFVPKNARQRWENPDYFRSVMEENHTLKLLRDRGQCFLSTEVTLTSALNKFLCKPLLWKLYDVISMFIWQRRIYIGGLVFIGGIVVGSSILYKLRRNSTIHLKIQK